ncbi:hypothetical protein [Kineosporia sp. NBRC 101731]|uniref:hypothetical protein n=1 Tax=Kineosporia sp. NBRC 101731 TaxID=3032199 RepID=UPI0024A2AC97|nr:hypothetical protein [Kineosporia sp. NBRC 101731]GLY32011.1 hypothetical protein Kisp02_53760 [Kineosporia sp. NBRC 101731]
MKATRTARRTFSCDMRRDVCNGIRKGVRYQYETLPPGGELGFASWTVWRACMACVEDRREEGYRWIRNNYGVDAFHGGEVAFDGRNGSLVGTFGSHLLVLLDGDEKPVQVHPRDAGLVYMVEATA